MGRHFLVLAAPAPRFRATHAIRLVAAHVTSRIEARQWGEHDYFAVPERMGRLAKERVIASETKQ